MSVAVTGGALTAAGLFFFTCALIKEGMRINLMRRESGGDRAVLIINRRNATDFGQQFALLSGMSV